MGENQRRNETRNARRRGYRRARRKDRAVSPVVATLILILIAVAAAAALYLWLTGWQSSVTKSIGTPTVPSDLKFSIGGSTVVYPLSQLAIKWFEENNSNTNITDQQGGSVAGVEAYCAGQVDVGAASSSYTESQLAGYGCSTAAQAATVQTVVAVDAIVGIASTSNPIFGNGAGGTITPAEFSFNATTALAIYVADSSTVPTQNSAGGLNSLTNLSALAPYLCGKPAADFTGGVFQANQSYDKACPTIGHGSSLPWGDIPFPAGCEKYVGGLYDLQGCTFGKENTNTITAYDPTGATGTQQGFVQKYLLTGAYLAKDSSSNSCGTNNELVSCDITVTPETTNDALAAAVAADHNGLGFTSYGIASAPSSKLNIAGYESGHSAPVFPSVNTVLVLGYRDDSASGAYGPWRVLEYLTDGAPASGTVVANYLNFVLGPEVNLNLADATGYISLYAA